MSDFIQIAFPAWPGTTITDDGITEPVIGWITTENGLAAITFDGQRRMIGDYEIALPDGAVVPSPLKGQKAKRAADTKAAPAKAPAAPSSGPEIEWKGKPFATTSWWRYNDDEHDFMFEVPPEQWPPKKTDVCQKIRRVDFDLYKGQGVEVRLYLDVKEGVKPEEEPDFEEELDEDLI